MTVIIDSGRSRDINTMERDGCTLMVTLAAILSAIGCLIYGYDTGIVSGSMIYIKEDFNLDSFWQEFEVSMTIIGACIFALLTGSMTGYFGRKKIILAASFIFALGSVIMAFAWEKYSLLVGRFIAGAGIGLASTSVPTYIAEVGPLHLRGAFVTLSYVFIVLGQLVAAIVAGLCSYLPDSIGWRYMVGLAAVPAIIQFIGFVFMPESPRWLVQKGRNEEAANVLTKLRGKKDITNELTAIQDEVDEAIKNEQEQQSCTTTLINAWCEKATRRALIVGTIVWATHELSGINIMMYYTATIVQMAGVYDKSNAVWIAAGIDAVYTIFTAAGIYLVEKMGRRPLLLISLAGTIVCLGITGIGFIIAEEASPISSTSSFSLHSSDIDDSCISESSCTSCVYRSDCGFCFVQSSPSQWQGFCSQGQQSAALHAPCSHPGSLVNGTLAISGESFSLPSIWSKDACPSKYGWIIMVAMTLYLCFFGPGIFYFLFLPLSSQLIFSLFHTQQTGIGAMAWTVNSEIFPLHARTACIAFTTGVNKLQAREYNSTRVKVNSMYTLILT